jgi:hypothetical protein
MVTLGVTSGANLTEIHRFEFAWGGERLQPRSNQHATVLGPIKAKPLRVAAKARPALTGPARGGCDIWRSGRKNARGAGRTKE